MSKVSSLHTVGDAIEALYVSPILSQHSVEGPTFLEMVARRLPNVDSFTITLGVIEM